MSRLTLGARVTLLTLATTLLLSAIAIATAIEAAKARELVDTALQQQGQRDYHEALADAARSSDRVMVLLLIAAGVILISGSITLIGLRRLVTGPVTAVAEQVRTIAEGDYERPIAMAGAPEVAHLASDVDIMRRKIASDLRQVSRLNAELELRAAELGRSNRDLEQFAYVASHDLQEPLRKVASFCQLLQRRYAGRLDEKADQYIAFAVDGAQRMQQLINDLLAFSRIGRTPAGFTEVDLNAVVADGVAQLEYPISRSKAKVTWDELPVVWGEAPLLAALVANLIGNAVKFHRPKVAPLVHVSAERVGDEWHVTCADNGIGIEPAYVEKVFVIFQRLHPKDKYAGTGIGLAIAKKIAEHHGGQIWVDTTVDAGAAVTFSLPVKPNLAAVAPAAPAPASTTTVH